LRLEDAASDRGPRETRIIIKAGSLYSLSFRSARIVRSA
jgi:hypothetical protein